MDVDFPARLKELITATGLSQAAFARKIRVSPSFLTEVLKARSQASERTLHTIAETFNVNIQWLEAGEGEMFEEEREQSAQKGALDKELVRVVIEAVEEGLNDLQLELKPDKKAQLVITLCEMFQEDQQVDKPTILRLIKLAA